MLMSFWNRLFFKICWPCVTVIIVNTLQWCCHQWAVPGGEPTANDFAPLRSRLNRARYRNRTNGNQKSARRCAGNARRRERGGNVCRRAPQACERGAVLRPVDAREPSYDSLGDRRAERARGRDD